MEGDDNLSITVEADDSGLDFETDTSVDTAAEPRGRIRSEVRVKGRGTTAREMTSTRSEAYERLDGRGDDRMDTAIGFTPGKSIEGYIVIATGVHEEAQEDDIHDKFADYGEIKNIHLPLDRRTGFVKGYALIEYQTRKEAQAAIDGTNGAQFMGQPLAVDFAFSAGPLAQRGRRHGGGRRK